MSSLLRAGLVAGLCALLAGSVAAQGRRWADPYRQGSEAVKAGRYQEGIALLEQALKFAPRQERLKVVEGVDQIEYFPYYYLGVAHLRLGNLDRAEEAFGKARECRCLTNDLSRLLEVFEGDLAARRKPGPKPGPTPPKPAETDPNFLRQLREAESAMTSGRFADAVKLFDALRSADDAEYARRNLAARRAEAERLARATELVRQADQLRTSGALTEAGAKYQEAESLVPGKGQPGLDEIRRRQAEYARLKAGADADQRANRFGAALEKLKFAEDADPEQYRADNMPARVQDLGRLLQGGGADRARDLLKQAQGHLAQQKYREAASSYRQVIAVDPLNAEAKSWLDASEQFESLRERGRALQQSGQLEQALQAFDDARRRDEARFNAEKLDALVRAIADKLGRLPEEQLAQVRPALVAYIQGDVARAASLLEPLSSESAPLDPRVRAHVLAYLGVAYADLSLAARQDAERADLRAKALDQFKRLVAIQPDYQLRESLISPRVREMLETVRTKR